MSHFARIGTAVLLLTGLAPGQPADLIFAEVSIFDTGNGVPIRNLTAQDFELRANGQSHPVEYFEGLRRPLDLVLLVDTSSGTRGSTNILRPAEAVLNQLQRDDRVAIASFGQQVQVISDLTGNIDQAVLAARRALAANGTPGVALTLNAITAGGRLFGSERSRERRRAMIVITHSEETPTTQAVRAASVALRDAGAALTAIVVPLMRSVPQKGSNVGINIPWKKQKTQSVGPQLVPDRGVAAAIATASAGEVLRPSDWEWEMQTAFARLRYAFLLGFRLDETPDEREGKLEVSLTDEARRRSGRFIVRHHPEFAH